MMLAISAIIFFALITKLFSESSFHKANTIVPNRRLKCNPIVLHQSNSGDTQLVSEPRYGEMQDQDTRCNVIVNCWLCIAQTSCKTHKREIIQ